MNQSEIEASTQYAYQRANQYGWHQVPAAIIHQIFEEIVQPNQLGFSLIKTGLFGNQVSQDVVHLIKLQAYKGATYSFRWGVSLAYVPHEWKPKPKWHRTLKSARFDLFEEPYDFLINDRTPWFEAQQYYIATQYGEICFRQDLMGAWERLRPAIMDWFASAHSSSDILQKALNQAQHNWNGAHHYPNPAMVAACILVRLGRTDEAVTMLGNLVQRIGESAKTYEGLIEAIVE